MSDGTVEVTLTYTHDEAREVARAIRYYVSNVYATHEDDDRLNLIATAIEAKSKPAEPTGLGAVVEEADGTRWVRIDGAIVRWLSRDCLLPMPWTHIEAVRVLSEGVPA